MKNLFVAGLCLILLSGCAGFKTTQLEERYDATSGKLTNRIKTEAGSQTFFDSKSNLSKWKASQTEKTQSAEVGGLGQSSSGTNAVSLINAIEGVIKAAQ